jgi:hypothetical protein
MRGSAHLSLGGIGYPAVQYRGAFVRVPSCADIRPLCRWVLVEGRWTGREGQQLVCVVDLADGNFRDRCQFASGAKWRLGAKRPDLV